MNRVWIYQADRFLASDEVNGISKDLKDFVSTWTAHGSALAGTGSVKENLFVVLEVDESLAGVTGCSIDKSVHFLKSLGQKYTVDFFDRMKISYRSTDGQVHLVNRSNFEQLIKDGDVNANTIVFNNLVQNSEEYNSKWQIPFKDSWHSKVF